LKVNDENRRIRIQDPDPDPNPLVRCMDPRIRIRIHHRMSWIRNTGPKAASGMIFQDDRLVPVSVFMKRVTRTIFGISKYFMEASKKFLTNITTVSSSKL
jgi:hypothetical protein